MSDGGDMNDAVRALRDEVSELLARVEQMEAENRHGDGLFPPVVDEPSDADGMVMKHSWRVLTKIEEGIAYWNCTDGADGGARAGSVIAPDGTVFDVMLDDSWNVFDDTKQLSLWLKVTLTVADGSLTAELTDTDPSADADPFNTTTAIFVFAIADVFTNGLIAQYQNSDIALEGLLGFDDADPVALDAAADPGESLHPARIDHVHPLPDGLLPDAGSGSQYQVLQLNDTLTPIWDWVRAH